MGYWQRYPCTRNVWKSYCRRHGKMPNVIATLSADCRKRVEVNPLQPLQDLA